MKTITAIIILATVVCNVHGSYYYYFTASRGDEILESDGQICVTTYDFLGNPFAPPSNEHITMEIRPNSASYPELTAESDGNK